MPISYKSIYGTLVTFATRAPICGNVNHLIGLATRTKLCLQSLKVINRDIPTLATLSVDINHLIGLAVLAKACFQTLEIVSRDISTLTTL
jgi:hypothetical protein